ncbi:leucyl aminopeptidase [Candidatus Uhrbacteria bacterium]|nr:leucyl aminopeptidase [Candidatus Uhrbacteria bacterium]
MDIFCKKGELQKEACDVLIVNEFEEVDEPGGATGAVNKSLDGLLRSLMKEEGFKGQAGQILLVRTSGAIPARRVLVVGLGRREDFCLESVREASASALNAIRSLKPKTVVSILHGAGVGGLDPMACAQAMVEGMRLAAYVFARYKKQKENGIGAFTIVTTDGRAIPKVKKGIAQGEKYAAGTLLTRDLVNTPAMDMRPIDLAQAAQAIAKKNSAVHVQVSGKTRLESMGAGGILGVAKGSDHEPFLVHLTYKPKTRSRKKIVLVGKGVTFDSGGLSLKPADYMMSMKCDMAGAAAVLGVFSVIAELGIKQEVHGIFATVENMPSGCAIRPGDVVRSLSKKTVEVLNTDAEGRLILMDCLTLAGRLKPQAIIDLATLTGACMVGLGDEITGVMANQPELAQSLLQAAAQTGEKMWELPLEKNYIKLLKSNVADLQNIGGKWGGALTAGLFLQEFVDPKTSWAHLDIAGPAFAERDLNAYNKKGATGHPVRTLLSYLQSL